MIYREEQKTSPPLFTAVGCICVYDGSLLLLKRAEDKSYPRLWGVPTGKLERGELPLQAMIRELFEETGILLSGDNLDVMTTFHVIAPDFSFLYSLFLARFDSEPRISLRCEEHTAFRWVSPNDALRMDLVPDMGECLIAVLPIVSEPRTEQLDLFTGRPSPSATRIYRLESSTENELASLSYLVGEPAGKQYFASFGPPCAGKTEAFRVMAKRDRRLVHVVDTTPLQKNSDQNFYLRKAFEQRDHRLFFHFQVDSLSSRFWTTMAAPANALVDETIYTTLAYSRALLRLGWIAEYEYKAFYRHYSLYSALMPKPAALYYFSCDENLLIARLRERGKKKSRSHEAYYLPEYVDALSYAFGELGRELRVVHGVKVVNVDSSAFSSDEIADRYAPEHID